MIYLFCAIASSAAVSAVLRIGDRKCTGKYSRFAMNYLSAAVFAFLTMQSREFLLDGSGVFALGLGAVQGILYLLSLVSLQSSIRKNGVILSGTFARLGLIIPMIFAIVAFGELPGVLQTIGFLIACAAIWMMQVKEEKNSDKNYSGLILLLVISGLTDSMAKIFEELGDRKLDSWFLLITFIVAFFLSVGMMIYHKEKLGISEIVYGCLVGIPNYGSVFFLLKALTSLPAVLVYPTYSAGTILAISLIGVAAFEERPRKRQWAALGMILVALILLNL